MTPGPWVRRGCLLIALLLLLALAWLGLSGGARQAPLSHTAGQAMQSAAQVAYGLLSLMAVGTTFWHRRWMRPVLAGWALALTVAGGLAPVVWGDSSAAVGLLSAVASLAVAGGIILLWRLGARGLTRTCS